MGQINNGLKEIALGNPLEKGKMATAWATLGGTTEGTTKFNMEDGTDTEFFTEEQESAITTVTKQGKVSVTFQVADPDINVLAKVFGGKINGDVYSHPSTPPDIFQSIRITPKKGFQISAPYAKIKAKMTPDIGRGSLLGVEVTATFLRNEAGEDLFTVKTV